MFTLTGFDVQKQRAELLLNVGLASICLAAAKMGERIGTIHYHLLATAQDQPSATTRVNPAALGNGHPAFDFIPLLVIDGVARWLRNF